MEIINAIILAIVQAITEFLPISSSGHLIIYHEFFGDVSVNDMAFDVALHFGTLLAVVWYFRAQVSRYGGALIRGIVKRHIAMEDVDQRLAWYIVLSVIPVGIVGLFFGDLINRVLRAPLVVAIALITGGVLLIIAERLGSKTCDLSSITPRETAKISFAQVLALIPGVSRSGITIIAGMTVGLKREAAATFSFLIAVPAIFLAAAKGIYDVLSVGVTSHDMFILFIGITISALVGYAVIGVLLSFVKKHTFAIFGWYRIAIGVALTLVILL